MPLNLNNQGIESGQLFIYTYLVIKSANICLKTDHELLLLTDKFIKRMRMLIQNN